ncbi:MAG: hypothetical protein PWP23_2037 [Candidatus Sumerlaeota bacterium]|nr:hypothetical protein [Candidatus Sumerlaeota bacterium]
MLPPARRSNATRTSSARLPRAADAAPRPEAADFLRHLGLERLPELLPVATVAELLNVSPQTVYRLLHCGELNGLQLHAESIRIFKRSLIAYLERRLL